MLKISAVRPTQQRCSKFNWADFLDNPNIWSAPETAFVQVEASVCCGIKIGQYLEVAHQCSVPNSFHLPFPSEHWQMVGSKIAKHHMRRSWTLPHDGKIEPNQDATISELLKDILSTSNDCKIIEIAEENVESFEKIVSEDKVGSSNDYILTDCFWIARVISACGSLLRVAWVLPPAVSKEIPEFWVQIGHDQLHPVGYGARHNLLPVPPMLFTDTLLKQAFEQLQDFTVDSCDLLQKTPSDNPFDLHTDENKSILDDKQSIGLNKYNTSRIQGTDSIKQYPSCNKNNSNRYESNQAAGTGVNTSLCVVYFALREVLTSSPVEAATLRLDTAELHSRINLGMWCEVLSSDGAAHGWPAQVVDNIGGRLLLRPATRVELGDDNSAENVNLSSNAEPRCVDGVTSEAELRDKYGNELQLISEPEVKCSQDLLLSSEAKVKRSIENYDISSKADQKQIGDVEVLSKFNSDCDKNKKEADFGDCEIETNKNVEHKVVVDSISIGSDSTNHSKLLLTSIAKCSIASDNNCQKTSNSSETPEIKENRINEVNKLQMTDNINSDAPKSSLQIKIEPRHIASSNLTDHQDYVNETNCCDFWMFCSDQQLRNLGWIMDNASNEYKYVSPSGRYYDKSPEFISRLLATDAAAKDFVPLPITLPGVDATDDECSEEMDADAVAANDEKIVNQEPLIDSEIKMKISCKEKVQSDCDKISLNSSDSKICEIAVGMSLELLHPHFNNCFHEARVTKVYARHRLEVSFESCTYKPLDGINDCSKALELQERLRNATMSDQIKNDNLVDPHKLEHNAFIANLDDFRLLPTGFCQRYKLQLHPFSSEGGKITAKHNTVESPKIDTKMNIVKNISATIPLESCLQIFDCADVDNSSPRSSISTKDEDSPKLEQSGSLPDICVSASNNSNYLDGKYLNTSEIINTSHILLEELPAGSSLDKSGDASYASIEITETSSIHDGICTVPFDVADNPDSNTTISSVDKPACLDLVKPCTTRPESPISLLTNLSLNSSLSTSLPYNSTKCTSSPNSPKSVPVLKIPAQTFQSSARTSVVAPIPPFLLGSSKRSSIIESEAGFKVGQFLETVDPNGNGDALCVASISKVAGNLIWLELHSSSNTVAEDIVRGCECCAADNTVVRSCHSTQLFPVGWSTIHGAELATPPSLEIPVPLTSGRPITPIKSLLSALERTTSYPASTTVGAGRSRWCRQLVLNHRCFPGPFLSKNKIGICVGVAVSGSVHSVLSQVVSQTLGAGFPQAKLSAQLTLALEQVAKPDWSLMPTKAKCKRFSVRGLVLAPEVAEDVPLFLQQLCSVLQCCPNLWTHDKLPHCPLNCHQRTVAAASSRANSNPPTREDRAAVLSPLKSLLGTRSLLDVDEDEEDMDWNNGGGNAFDGLPVTSATSNSNALENDQEATFIPVISELSTDLLNKDPLMIMEVDGSKDITSPDDGPINTVPAESKKSSKIFRSYTIKPATVNSDPITWNVEDVFIYVSSVPSIAHYASWMRRESIDGRALLLLNLATLTACLKLPHTALLPLAKHLCSLKMSHLISTYNL